MLDQGKDQPNAMRARMYQRLDWSPLIQNCCRLIHLRSNTEVKFPNQQAKGGSKKRTKTGWRNSRQNRNKSQGIARMLSQRNKTNWHRGKEVLRLNILRRGDNETQVQHISAGQGRREHMRAEGGGPEVRRF